MAKTLILGNKEFSNRIAILNDVTSLQVPTLSINKETEIVEFIKSKIPTDLDRIIVNINEIDTELALDIALRIRLMIFALKKTSLSAIIFVSESSLEAIIEHRVSYILLMTKGVYWVNQDELADAIENANPITPTEYVSEFLDLIKIKPKENTEGRHSIANEWGADALSKVITSGIKSKFIPLRASSSLYFMYCSVIALNVGDIDKIVNDDPCNFSFDNLKITDRFNYLLIDDEAQKGWGDVLEKMMPNALATIYSKKARNYEDLPQDIKKDIEEGKYDIIFLDLRMNGVEEEVIKNPEEFSGMKILNAIKERNTGIQVIMFTATNKGWNVKALLDAGANGYYMKESPEYHFKISYSKQNAEAFIKTIKNCINDSYLKEIWKKKKEALETLDSYEELNDLYRAMKVNWESAFILLNQHHYNEALLQLLMAIEAYANKYTKEYPVNNRAVVYRKNVNFKCKDEDDESCIFDENGSYYQTHAGVFKNFQKGRHPHIVDISIVEDGSYNGNVELSLPVKIAAVLDQHLETIDGIKQICELNFIRNNRLAHHGVSNEYKESERPVTKEDCQFIFDLTYKLIMAK